LPFDFSGSAGSLWKKSRPDPVVFVVAGGKFANGARTGAMQYLFNQVGDRFKAMHQRYVAAKIHNAYEAEIERVMSLSTEQFKEEFGTIYGLSSITKTDVDLAKYSVLAELEKERVGSLHGMFSTNSKGMIIGNPGRFVLAKPMSALWPIFAPTPAYSVWYQCASLCLVDGIVID